LFFRVVLGLFILVDEQYIPNIKQPTFKQGLDLYLNNRELTIYDESLWVLKWCTSHRRLTGLRGGWQQW